MSERSFSPELPVLDAETAARVANHFRMEVYGVGHGHTAEQLAAMFPNVDPSLFRATVTDEQRNITRVLADSLGPDDVLFREAYGYTEQEPETSLADQANAPSAEQRRAAKEMLAADQNQFDAIAYGATHAIINGTRVIYADCNATQRAAHEAAGSNSDQVDQERDTAALATMITYAIDGLPPEDTPIPKPEERRRLVLSIGGSHVDRIRELAADANLPITIHSTEETQRIVLARLAAAHLGDNLKGLVNLLRPEDTDRQA